MESIIPSSIGFVNYKDNMNKLRTTRSGTPVCLKILKGEPFWYFENICPSANLAQFLDFFSKKARIGVKQIDACLSKILQQSLGVSTSVFGILHFHICLLCYLEFFDGLSNVPWRTWIALLGVLTLVTVLKKRRLQGNVCYLKKLVIL